MQHMDFTCDALPFTGELRHIQLWVVANSQCKMADMSPMDVDSESHVSEYIVMIPIDIP